MNTRRTMFFLHGWGTHPIIWDPLLARFPEARALALPGYAGSETATTLDHMAEKIAMQIDEGSVLVGWSLGGLLAARIAMDYKDKVSSLVLIGATPCFVNRDDWQYGVAAEVFEQFAQSLDSDYADTIRRFLALQAQGSGNVREVLASLRRRLLVQPRPPEGVLEAGLEILQNKDLRRDMAGLGVPVTLIHGTGDKLAPLSAARWLENSIAGSRLYEVPGAGHAPFLSHAQLVADMISGAVHG